MRETLKEPFHTHFRVWVSLIVEDPTVTVTCRTATKVPFLYLNLCLRVMFNSLSCPFTSISFLINCNFGADLKSRMAFIISLDISDFFCSLQPLYNWNNVESGTTNLFIACINQMNETGSLEPLVIFYLFILNDTPLVFFVSATLSDTAIHFIPSLLISFLIILHESFSNHNILWSFFVKTTRVEIFDLISTNVLSLKSCY